MAPHRRAPDVYDRGLRRLIPLPHHLPDPPRPGRLGPFHGPPWLRPVYFGLLVPQIVLAALVVPLALTTIYRAWCALRPPPAARACDAAHLALRLDQRRSGVCPPLPLRSLSPTFFGTQVPAYGSCHCPSFV